MEFVDSPEALRAWQFDQKTVPAKSSGSAAGAGLSAVGALRQDCWWWMVLAGFFMLVLEMALSGWKRGYDLSVHGS